METLEGALEVANDGALVGEQDGAKEGTAIRTKLGLRRSALRLQLGVAVETLEGALEVANDGALDGEQVGATEDTPLGTKLGP